MEINAATISASFCAPAMISSLQNSAIKTFLEIFGMKVVKSEIRSDPLATFSEEMKKKEFEKKQKQKAKERRENRTERSIKKTKKNKQSNREYQKKIWIFSLFLSKDDDLFNSYKTYLVLLPDQQPVSSFLVL